ncbi:unnamed protein product [Lampetra fluviatilis]
MSRAWDGWEKDASDNGSSRGEGAASHRARVESAEEARVLSAPTQFGAFGSHRRLAQVPQGDDATVSASCDLYHHSASRGHTSLTLLRPPPLARWG